MSDETVTTWSPIDTNASITMTEAAIAHVKKELSKQAGVALRFGLKKAGCSGFAYTVDIVNQIEPSDQLFTITDEVKVAIEAKNLPFLLGTTIDYVREGLNSRFKFINPNEKGSCGCGESISV